MSKKSFAAVLIITLLVIISAIADANSLEEAHEESLKLYKAGKVKEAIKVLEDNGVREILDSMPRDMYRETYITLLINYGFYLSKTEDRYMEALPVLQRVIEVAPARAVAYLNTGDIYLKIYQENKDKSLKEKITENYYKYLSFLEEGAYIASQVRMFLKAESFAKTIEEFGKIQFEMEKGRVAESFEEDFFNDFFDDFINGKNIEYVEPILTTDNINNKKLRQYFMNDTGFIEEVITDVVSSPMPIEYRSEYDYKLYHIDFDHNPENGKEYLFYSGGYLDVWYGVKQLYINYYRLLDFEEKKIRDAVSVYKTFDYIEKKPVNNFNGIIKYKGRYFIYDVRNEDFPCVDLYAWNGKSDMDDIGIAVSFRRKNLIYLRRQCAKMMHAIQTAKKVILIGGKTEC